MLYITDISANFSRVESTRELHGEVCDAQEIYLHLHTELSPAITSSYALFVFSFLLIEKQIARIYPTLLIY